MHNIIIKHVNNGWIVTYNPNTVSELEVVVNTVEELYSRFGQHTLPSEVVQDKNKEFLLEYQVKTSTKFNRKELNQ